jgi:hypothetical protein
MFTDVPVLNSYWAIGIIFSAIFLAFSIEILGKYGILQRMPGVRHVVRSRIERLKSSHIFHYHFPWR